MSRRTRRALEAHSKCGGRLDGRAVGFASSICDQMCLQRASCRLQGLVHCALERSNGSAGTPLALSNERSPNNDPSISFRMQTPAVREALFGKHSF